MRGSPGSLEKGQVRDIKPKYRGSPMTLYLATMEGGWVLGGGGGGLGGGGGKKTF